MKNEIIPILIIGSARNGTTDLENLVASLTPVAGVEHWLHHGSHESNIYLNYKYWGDLSDETNHLRFLYQYKSSDYFQLCKGDINFYLEHPREDFFTFFLDLMDRYAQKENNRFWVTKLDPCFFYDREKRTQFIQLLHERYQTVKFISIRRNFADAFNSYRSMAGKNYHLRRKTSTLLPSLIYEASRYVLIYNTQVTGRNDDILTIEFDDYITRKEAYLHKIAAFLEISPVTYVDINRFQKNTSFRNREKKDLPRLLSNFIPVVLRFFKRFPQIPELIWRTYYRKKISEEPIYRRLLKYRYFRDELIQELEKEHENALVEKIKEEAEVPILKNSEEG